MPSPSCLMLSLLLACTGGGGDSGQPSEDGGAEDGGTEDGGTEDGGTEDGGTEDGGAEAPPAPLGTVNPADFPTWVAPEPGGYGGYAVQAVPDLDGDGVGELLVGAARDSGSAARGGAAFLVLGPITADGSLAEAELIARGDESWWLGTSLAAVGDVDGDDIGDLLLGAPDDMILEPVSERGAGPGRAALVSGTARGTLAPGELVVFEGEREGDKAGCEVAGGADLDGDGVGDVMVGAYLHGSGAQAGGAAYVLHGPITASRALADADLKLVGTGAGEQAGASLQPVGDVNGDGHVDLVVSADGDERDVPGRAYLVAGPLVGTHALRDSYLALVDSTEPNDNTGSTVVGGQDLDGDAVPDLLLCAYDAHMGTKYPVGAAYLLSGPLEGTSTVQEDARTTVWGTTDGYHATEACGLAGDVDSDGRQDVLFGAHDHGVDEEGRAYLFYELPEGEVSVEDADAIFLGLTPQQDLGWAVGGGVDLTGDGYQDLLISDRRLYDTQDLQGAAFVIPGGRR